MNKKQSNEQVKSILQNCNHDMAINLITNTFKGSVIPSDLADLLTQYTNNPCLENAQNLCIYDANFLNFFLLARSDGFTTQLFESGALKFKGDKQIPVN